MTTAVEYARAFRRNCPGVRLYQHELEELERLFFVCQQEAIEKGEKRVRASASETEPDASRRSK